MGLAMTRCCMLIVEDTITSLEGKRTKYIFSSLITLLLYFRLILVRVCPQFSYVLISAILMHTTYDCRFWRGTYCRNFLVLVWLVWQVITTLYTSTFLPTWLALSFSLSCAHIHVCTHTAHVWTYITNSSSLSFFSSISNDMRPLPVLFYMV